MKGVGTPYFGLAALALAAPPAAHAEEGPTREEYVAKVDPICQANTEANKRILEAATKGTSPEPAKLSRAGAQFIHASAVFGKTVEEVVAVPRPPDRRPAAAKVVRLPEIVQTNLRKLGKALKEGNKVRAAHEQIRVERSSNAANNVSFVFEFHYCQLNRSRFL